MKRAPAHPRWGTFDGAGAFTNLVLREHQVRALLVSAENALGSRLKLLRDHLASRDPVPYIWELVVIDALLRAKVTVKYEVQTSVGLTPDLLVALDDSRSLWLEVAYVRDRFAADQGRLDALLRRLTREEEKRGIPIGSIEWRADGNPSPSGFEKVLPAEHELPRFFRAPEVIAFFREITATRDRRITCDFRNIGYTIAFSYVPRAGAGPFGRSGGSLVSDVPRQVEEHSVYRALCLKARKYSKIPNDDPIVVCVGSENSMPASTWRDVHAVRLEDAVNRAFRDYPALSAALVVSIESNNSFDNYGRVARARVFLSRWSTRPLSNEATDGLRELDFNGVEYGGSWNEWDGRRTIAERRKGLSGGLRFGGRTGAKGGMMIEVSAEVVLQMLSGVANEADFIAEYCLDKPPGAGAQNPFRRVWEEGRALVGLTLMPADPRGRAGDMIRFDFGPRQEMILQVHPDEAPDEKS